jgi:acetyltransferase
MVTPFFVDCEAIARRIAETVPKLQKPILACVMTNENWASTVETIKGAGIPVYEYPETVSQVLAAMVRCGELRRRLAEPAAVVSGDKDKAREILSAASGGFISQEAAFRVLAAYEIPAAVTHLAAGSKVPADLKFPAVLKVDSEAVTHKSDAGGVMLNIKTKAALKRAVAEMSERFPGAGFVVQEQAAQGTEIIVGFKREPGVGPVIMFGMGGIQVELLKDVVFKLAPLSREEAARMVRGIRSLPLLTGGRGILACDLAAIENLLVSVSQMAMDLPEITEMDLNPAFVYPEGQGLKVVDVRIKKEQSVAQAQAQ